MNGLDDLTKPYQISIAKENQQKLDAVYKDLKDREENGKSGEETNAGQPLMITNGPLGHAPLGVNNTGMGFGNGGF